MRAFLTGLTLFAFSALAARAAGVEFVRVWPGWRDADAFIRIGEYFGRGEQTGRQIVLRTQPGNRTGYYFLIRLKHQTDLAGTKLVLHVIRPDRPDAALFTFPLPTTAAGETVFDLGLTGSDWPAGKKSHPVAWKLELLAADGALLGDEKSFLWEK